MANTAKREASQQEIPALNSAKRDLPSLDPAKRDLPSLDPVTCLKVIDALMNHEGRTAGEISAHLGIPLKTAMAVMAHPEFVKRFHKIKKAVAKTEFDTVAYDRMIEIINRPERFDEHGKSSEDKNAIAAVKALSDILGISEKKGSTVNVNLSFDAIIRDSKARGTENDVIFPGFESD